MEDAKSDRFNETNVNPRFHNRENSGVKITRSSALMSGRASAKSSDATEEMIASPLNAQGDYSEEFRQQEFDEITSGIEDCAEDTSLGLTGLSSYAAKQDRIDSKPWSNKRASFRNDEDLDDNDDVEAAESLMGPDEGDGADRTEVENPVVGPPSRRIGRQVRKFAYKQTVFCDQLNKRAQVLEDEGGPTITVRAQNGQIYEFNREDVSAISASNRQVMEDSNPGQTQPSGDDDAYPTPAKRNLNLFDTEHDRDESDVSMNSFAERRRARRER